MKNKKIIQESDIIFIKENYPKFGNKYCANALNCEKSTITRYAKKLGIRIEKWDAPEGFKLCYCCKNILSLDQFYPKTLTKITKTDACKQCQRLYRKQREKRLKNTEEGRRNLTADNLLNNARYRAKKSNLSVDLDKEWILENMKEYCPVLGLKFVYCFGKTYDESPSIDKLVPELGYIKSNCRIICHKANRLKSNSTIKEMEKILQYMKDNI